MSHKILIQSNGGLGRVSAYLPDEFSMGLEHHWENPFQVDMSKEVKAGLSWVGKQFGVPVTGNFDPSAIGNALGIDAFVYMGSSPFVLSLVLEFVVYESIQLELIQPVKQMIKMSVPKAGTLSTLSSLDRPDTVSVSIPGVLSIPTAYIQTINIDMLKPLVSDGIQTVPLRTRVPINLIRAEIVTTSRVDDMLFV